LSQASAALRGAEIPVVDLAPLATGREDSFRGVGDAIRAAATSVGFFYVRNHGVPLALIERAAALGREFFAAPAELKRQVAINSRHRGFVPVGGANVAQARTFDLKETFSWGLELPETDPDVLHGNPLMGPNNWPAFLPALRPALYEYFEASFRCGDRLLRAIAVSLGIAPDFFALRYRKPFARGQIVHYPPQPPELGVDQFGIGQHTDFGCITLLWQDQNGGLQILNRQNEWIAASPIEGTLVINIGDLLERWSNDRFKSTLHRVVNTSGRDRISLTVFYDPDYPTIVDPRDMGLAPGETPRYEPVGAGDHIRARFDKTFAYRHRERSAAQ
jgi:isopenicillin N synthase-like dioxygenase